MISKLTWEMAEQDLRDALGLDSTPGSGNQWNAPGDAVDNRHHRDTKIAFMVDTKSTKHKSYSVSEKFLKEWTEKTLRLGKTFLLHIQFQDHEKQEKTDWVLCSLDDFVEIYLDPPSTEVSQAYKELSRLLSTFKDERQRDKYLGLLEKVMCG